MVAVPTTAGGQSLHCDDAGAGMIWTEHPVPERETDCGLQLFAKSSWQQIYGGTLGPAGEIHARRLRLCIIIHTESSLTTKESMPTLCGFVILVTKTTIQE